MGELFPNILASIMVMVAIALGGLTIRTLKNQFGIDRLRRLEREWAVKKDITETIVLFVQQVYRAAGGEAKYAHARKRVIQRLEARGIEYTEQELEDLIESSVKTLKYELGSTWRDEIHVNDLH